YLYDHGTVWTASQTVDDVAMFMPYRVQLLQPTSAEDEARNCEIFRVDRIQYRMALFGDLGINVLDVGPSFWMGPQVSALVQAHRFEVMPHFVGMLDAKHTSAEDRQRILVSASGILKQVLILLLILTRANKHVYFTETEAQPRRIWRGNKQVPLVSYNQVTMH